MKKTQKNQFFLFLFIVSIFFFLNSESLSADSTASVAVTATVDVSCGDNVAEGFEQCDGSDLEGQTCFSYGYSSGSLSCNANCTFNTSACASGGGGGGEGGGGGGGWTPVATRVILQGKAYPTAKITILVDGKVATLINADSQAVFKADLTTLTEGVYNFGLWAEDKEGLKSITYSFTVTITEGRTTTVSNIFLPPTIELEKVNLSKGEALKISGQTAPKSEITLSVESEQEIIKKTFAEQDGDWKYALDTGLLEEGAHTTRAKAETEDSLKSSYSKVLAFYIGKYATTEICAKADFNKDGKTNLVDFSIMLYWWGKYSPCADQNKSGKVDLPDFSILMYYWTG